MASCFFGLQPLTLLFHRHTADPFTGSPVVATGIDPIDTDCSLCWSLSTRWGQILLNVWEIYWFGAKDQFNRIYGSVATCYLLQWILKLNCGRCAHLLTVALQRHDNESLCLCCAWHCCLTELQIHNESHHFQTLAWVKHFFGVFRDIRNECAECAQTQAHSLQNVTFATKKLCTKGKSAVFP